MLAASVCSLKWKCAKTIALRIVNISIAISCRKFCWKNLIHNIDDVEVSVVDTQNIIRWHLWCLTLCTRFAHMWAESWTNAVAAWWHLNNAVYRFVSIIDVIWALKIHIVIEETSKLRYHLSYQISYHFRILFGALSLLLLRIAIIIHHHKTQYFSHANSNIRPQLLSVPYVNGPYG